MRRIFKLSILFFSFITLIGLGTWQVQRLEWKTEIINRLEAEYTKDPADYLYSFHELTPLPDAALSIRYGSIRGQFNYSKEVLMGPYSHDKIVGYKVITPLETNEGHILVQRGWINVDNKEHISDTTNRPIGVITINGIFRLPDWNRFTSNNSPENDIWMKLDPAEIGQAKNIDLISPYILYAEKSSKDFGIIQLQAERIMPRNKHLQYAIFWYSLAIILLIISGIYYWRFKATKTN